MKQPKASRKQAKGATARHARRPKRGTGKSVTQHHPAGQHGAHHAAKPAHPAGHGAGAGGGAHKPPQHTAAHHAAHPHHRAVPAKKPVKRGLALGEGVACCVAEALAASLRLSGRSVEPSDVLALYEHTARDENAGASIWETLEALSGCGLAGVRPVRFREVMPCEADGLPSFPRGSRAGLILGVDLPGPHTVLATPEGWWSWGGLYDPACWPDAVIEEAWTVQWAA